MSVRRQTAVSTNTPFSSAEDQALATRVLNGIASFCSSTGLKARPASEWRHNKSTGRISVALEPTDQNTILDFEQINKERTALKASTSLLHEPSSGTFFLTVQEARLSKLSIWQVLLAAAFLVLFFYAIYAYGVRHDLWCGLLGTCAAKKN